MGNTIPGNAKPKKTIGAKVSDEIYIKIAEEAKAKGITRSEWLLKKIENSEPNDELKSLQEENYNLKKTNNKLIQDYQHDISNMKKVNPVYLKSNVNQSLPQILLFLGTVAILGIFITASVILKD